MSISDIGISVESWPGTFRESWPGTFRESWPGMYRESWPGMYRESWPGTYRESWPGMYREKWGAPWGAPCCWLVVTRRLRRDFTLPFGLFYRRRRNEFVRAMRGWYPYAGAVSAFGRHEFGR